MPRTAKQKDELIDRRIDRQTGRQTDRQIGRQTDGQTDRQTDGQTGRDGGGREGDLINNMSRKRRRGESDGWVKVRARL